MDLYYEKCKRSDYWDNIKGLLILLVVFAHFLIGLRTSCINILIVDAIYYFHMPAFVFVSGYFSKSKNSKSTKSILKLLVAYIIFISGFILYDVYKNNQPHILYSYTSEWYLMSLIIWRLITPFLSKFKWIILVSLVFSVIAGYWPDIGGNNILSINKIVTFYPYFITGYMFSKNASEDIQNQSTVNKLATGSIALICVIIGEILSYSYLDINIQHLLPNNYSTFSLTEPLTRIAIIYVAFSFILFMLSCSSTKKLTLLTKAGKNSLAIYLIHRPFTIIFHNVFANVDTDIQLISSVIFTIIIAVAFGSNYIANIINKLLDNCSEILMHHKSNNLVQKCKKISLYTFIILIFVAPILSGYFSQNITNHNEYNKIYRVINSETKERYKNSVKLLFCGDLILLEDQVKNAYDGYSYDFSGIFEYTKQYIAEADFSIGVLEGPFG